MEGGGGFGTHEFEFDVEGVDYSQVDLQRPIVAYPSRRVARLTALSGLSPGIEPLPHAHLTSRGRGRAKSLLVTAATKYSTHHPGPEVRR
jgi:hypothetical protein